MKKGIYIGLTVKYPMFPYISRNLKRRSVIADVLKMQKSEMHRCRYAVQEKCMKQ